MCVVYDLLCDVVRCVWLLVFCLRLFCLFRVVLYDVARSVVCVALCLRGLLLFVRGLCEIIVRCCVCFVNQMCLCVVWFIVLLYGV